MVIMWLREIFGLIQEWLNRWETNEWTIILGSGDGC